MNKLTLLNLLLLCFSLFAKAQSGISADQMNVLFIGVDNPVTIIIGNIPQNEFDFSLSQGKIEKLTGRANSYIVNVSTPGDMTINVSHKGKAIAKQVFHVKRIPNPVARLPMYERSNLITAATLRTITGIITVLENFDFDAKCVITSFICIHKSVDCKTTTIKNEGSMFNAQLLALIKQAKIGDTFIFQEVKSKCPEDNKERLLNDIVVGIK